MTTLEIMASMAFLGLLVLGLGYWGFAVYGGMAVAITFLDS